MVCLAILLGLGFWQLDRRAWKEDLLATIATRLDKPPEPLPQQPAPAWEYRRVLVQGEVVPENWFRFPNRSREGKVGDVLMLLVWAESGRLVLVEHGLIGFGEPLPTLPATVAKEGILRLPAEPGWLTPANDPQANLWYTADLPAIARAAGTDPASVQPFYVASKSWTPHLANNHLAYAVTWFSFAAIFVVIFVLFHRQKTGERSITRRAA